MRSAVVLEKTRAFPKNTEMEAMLTMVSDGGNPRLLRDVAPDAHAVTVRGAPVVYRAAGAGGLRRVRFQSGRGIFRRATGR